MKKPGWIGPVRMISPNASWQRSDRTLTHGVSFPSPLTSTDETVGSHCILQDFQR